MEKEVNKQFSKEKMVPNKTLRSSYGWVYLLIILGIITLYITKTKISLQETSWTKFKNEMLIDHDVEKIMIVNQETVEVFIKKESLTKEKYKKVANIKGNYFNPGPHFCFTIGSIEFFEQQLREAQANFSETEKIEEIYVKKDNWWSGILPWAFPLLLLILLWFFYGRLGRRMSGSLFDFGKSGAQEYDNDKKNQTSFKDIAGYEEAKTEIMEVVDFLKYPERFTKLGAKIPKGILLLGPPGTGKTHMAKAVAGEAGVPFFSLSGSEFVEMFVGVGAARVRDLFKIAKERAPSIVFIDEIDSIGRVRGAAVSVQANDERESTLNQLLAEMDGFDVHTNVIVIAATNRPDILDSALLRPGRFDRHVFLELPNKKEREAIFKVHMRSLTIDKSLDMEYIISQTPGFSGADIANVCNEAALIAARNKKEVIGKQDFMDAIDRIVAGPEKKSKIISPSERKIVAYHEAGHAIVSWMLTHVDPLIKVSIIPRGRSLGAAMYSPEERQIYTYTQFKEQLSTALGGRVAEEIIFNETSSGALDDLEKVTKEAYLMVASFGMSEKVGNVSFHDSSDSAMAFQKPFSEATAQLIDSEVRKLTSEAHDQAKLILLANLPELDKLADLLLKKEIIYKEELEAILGKRPKEGNNKELINLT